MIEVGFRAYYSYCFLQGHRASGRRGGGTPGSGQERAILEELNRSLQVASGLSGSPIMRPLAVGES
jgi:hypothetical protein